MRNAWNENGVPLEPLSGVNGHHRDIRIKVIGETSQGALGKDAHDDRVGNVGVRVTP